MNSLLRAHVQGRLALRKEEKAHPGDPAGLITLRSVVQINLPLPLF
ncbi:MAG: hypothetical protein WED07_08240 [Candidatus Freyarchaeum deiterrae]